MKSAAILIPILLLHACGSRSAWPDPGENFPSVFRSVLENADRIEVFALHPFPYEAEGKAAPGQDFQGYKILGQAKIESESARKELVSLLYRGMGEPAPFAACFNPRHGIRALRGESIVELVICFQCNTVRLERPGAPRLLLPISPKVEPEMSALYASVGLTIHGRKNK